MASTTPTSAHRRSGSAQKPIPSRPTTPLRPPSRGSLRASQTQSQNGQSGPISTPLDSLTDAFGELSDGMADLEANFMHLQLMHESLARFSESFAAFLYGLNMNAFCVDFPEAPIPESFKRFRERNPNYGQTSSARPSYGPGELGGPGMEETFLTTDTSFVENPPSSKMTSKFTNPAPAPRTMGRGGSGPSARGGTTRGVPRGTRGSGLARATGRGRASVR